MFNFIDVIIAALIISGGFFGFQTGAVASIFYLGSGFAGIWAARHFTQGPGIKYFLIFIAGAGLVIIAGFIFSKIFKGLVLGMLDRIGGVLFGIILAALISFAAVSGNSPRVSSNLRKAMHNSWFGSSLSPKIERTLPTLSRPNPAPIKQFFSRINPIRKKQQ